MKEKIKNSFKITLIPILTSSLIATTALLTSCSVNNKIVFANFSGYMNPEVQEITNAKYGVQWEEYESNENIPTFLKNGTYDLAVATQYKIVELARTAYQSLINKNTNFEAIIQPIDWSKFNLSGLNLTKDATTQLYDFSSLKTYFTTQTWSLLTAYDISGDGKIDENCKDNLLNWTIPYFAQTLSFGYRGPEIQPLKGENVTFKKIFDYFKTPEAKERLFSGRQTVSLIKDERTNYDLARLLANKPIFIENDNKISSIEKLEQDYSILDDAMKNAPKQINLEGDSNTILNQLALNQISAAITYNGDLIYASNGGDYSKKLEQEKKLPNQDNFHIITPKDTLVCFDGIVLSSKINKNFINNAYNIVKDIAIPTENNQIINDSNTINNCFPLDEEQTNLNINYLPLMNFDYVYYNPVWNCFNEAIHLSDSNLADAWQKPFFSQIKAIKTNGATNPSIDGYYKNIEYPTNSFVSSNLNVANITFVNNSVK